MTNEPEQPLETPPQPGLKFLEATVYIMGGLLVVMLIVLVGGVIWKASRRGDAPPEAPKLVELALPPQSSVEQMTLDGDRLAIRTAQEIVVVDIRKGTILARIALPAR